MNPTEAAPLPPRRYIRKAELLARVPYSMAWVYRLVQYGRFPKPYRIGARAIAWDEAEVEEFLRGLHRAEASEVPSPRKSRPETVAEAPRRKPRPKKRQPVRNRALAVPPAP